MELHGSRLLQRPQLPEHKETSDDEQRNMSRPSSSKTTPPPVLRGLDSQSINLIATDPPFNKGAGTFEWTTKEIYSWHE